MHQNIELNFEDGIVLGKLTHSTIVANGSGTIIKKLEIPINSISRKNLSGLRMGDVFTIPLEDSGHTDFYLDGITEEHYIFI